MFTGDGVGGSGDFLMSALHRAGFSNIPTSHHPQDGLALKDVFIAAAVRCAPPDNKPTPEEIAHCLPHLDAETAALPHVRVVVGLGRIGFDVYLQLLKHRGIAVKPKPEFGHARAHTLPNGQTLIGCYHPSRQNTNTGTPISPDEAAGTNPPDEPSSTAGPKNVASGAVTLEILDAAGNPVRRYSSADRPEAPAAPSVVSRFWLKYSRFWQ